MWGSSVFHLWLYFNKSSQLAYHFVNEINQDPCNLWARAMIKEPPNALLILFPWVLSHDMNRDENYPFPMGIGLSSDFRLRSWYSPSLILYLTHSCMEFGAADIKWCPGISKLHAAHMLSSWRKLILHGIEHPQKQYLKSFVFRP